MNEEFHFYDKQVVIKSSSGICPDSEELIKSSLFKRVLQKFLKYLKKKFKIFKEERFSFIRNF
jgi:hypothetical protein